MVIEKILCDKCGEELNGRGYSVSIEYATGDCFKLDVRASIDETGGEHYCGKQCLMLKLNNLVDEISEMRNAECGVRSSREVTCAA